LIPYDCSSQGTDIIEPESFEDPFLTDVFKVSLSLSERFLMKGPRPPKQFWGPWAFSKRDLANL
jgi:hypothetical protein